MGGEVDLIDNYESREGVSKNRPVERKRSQSLKVIDYGRSVGRGKTVCCRWRLGDPESKNFWVFEN